MERGRITQKWSYDVTIHLGTCHKLAGGSGWKQREGHDFLRLRKGRGHEKWAVKRGRVMQMYASDHAEVHHRRKRKFFIGKNNWEK